MRLEHLLAEIEKKGAKCLTENPQPDHVRDLAQAALDLVKRIRAGEHPYRTGPPSRSDDSGEAVALVAFERALDECRQDLARAKQEIERLKKP